LETTTVGLLQSGEVETAILYTLRRSELASKTA
jgi:hypothetical protein